MSAITRTTLRVAALILVVAAAAVLGACSEESSQSNEGSTGAATAPSATTAERPSDDQLDTNATLRVVETAEPRTLIPNVSLLKNDQRQSGSILEYIVKTTPDFKLSKEGLVTDWEQTAPTEWTFTLRPDVKFSNGEPFDADAARFSILFSRDKSQMSAYYRSITDVEATDDHTVVVKTKIPQSNVPTTLAIVPALPPKHFREVGADAFGKEPIGTGPFVLDRWTPGQSLAVKRNADYWGGAPALAGIEFTWSPEASSRTSLLQSGQVDFASLVPPQAVESLKSGGDTEVSTAATNRIAGLFFAQLKRPPFDDPALRMAAAQAIDRDALANLFYDGAGAVPWRSLYSPNFPEIERDHPYIEPDPEAARAAVKKAVAAGVSPNVGLNWPQNNGPVIDDTAQAVAQMLEDVGFKVKQQPLELGEFYEKFFSKGFDELAISTFGYPYPSEDSIYQTLLTTKSQTPTCTNPRVDEILDEALASEDPKEIEQLWREADEIMVYKDPCWMPLYNQVDNWAMKSTVGGFAPRLDELIDWEQVYVAK